jgi:hypothetical protein
VRSGTRLTGWPAAEFYRTVDRVYRPTDHPGPTAEERGRPRCGRVVIVGVEPKQECLATLGLGAVGPGVGPLIEQGAVEAFDFSVGLRPIGAGAFVGDADCGRHCPKCPCTGPPQDGVLDPDGKAGQAINDELADLVELREDPDDGKR